MMNRNKRNNKLMDVKMPEKSQLMQQLLVLTTLWYSSPNNHLCHFCLWSNES